MNVTGLQWWSVNIGSCNGLVPSGDKPLPEPMVTQMSYGVTRPQWVKCHTGPAGRYETMTFPGLILIREIIYFMAQSPYYVMFPRQIITLQHGSYSELWIRVILEYYIDNIGYNHVLFFHLWGMEYLRRERQHPQLADIRDSKHWPSMAFKVQCSTVKMQSIFT